MPQPKYIHAPESEAAAPAHVRLANDEDAFVPPPTHEMHEYLWTFVDEAPEPVIVPYPGWVRVAVPVLASIVLWGVIIAAVVAVR
jgi:hypothetical protein